MATYTYTEQSISDSRKLRVELESIGDIPAIYTISGSNVAVESNQDKSIIDEAIEAAGD